VRISWSYILWVFERAFDMAAQSIRCHFVEIWKDDTHALCCGGYWSAEARQFGVVDHCALLEKAAPHLAHLTEAIRCGPVILRFEAPSY